MSLKGGSLTVLLKVDKDHSLLFPFLFFLLPYPVAPLRSLTLLIREVLAGSVFLPSMDYLADPVSVDTDFLKPKLLSVQDHVLLVFSKPFNYYLLRACKWNTKHEISALSKELQLCHIIFLTAGFSFQDTVNHLLLIFIDNSPVSNCLNVHRQRNLHSLYFNMIAQSE